MRIAYICMDQGIPVFGRKGCSIHVQEVVRTLLAHGARVDLFSPRCEGDPPPGLESARLHALPAPDVKHPAYRERAAFQTNYKLRQTLEQAGPFDLVYERYSLWSHEGMDYAQSKRVPGVLEVNSPLIDEQARERVLVDRGLAAWVAHRAFGNATILAAVSDEVAAYLERYPEVDGRLHVVPNGVNPDRFPAELEPTCPAPSGTFTVGFVGTLKPWHGVPILIEAFDRLRALEPDVRLLLVGDGPERERLEADVSRRGLRGAVHFTGSVDATDVPGLLASMEVAVAPYPNLAYFYFSPLKVFEYMAAGRSVVASRIGQLKGLVDHEVSGLLCAPGDAAELTEALVRLRREQALRDRLGKAARMRVRQYHTWEAAVRRVFRLAGMLPEFGSGRALGAA
jgi:glycosyltransferase involved in cell wall biosynthesis